MKIEFLNNSGVQNLKQQLEQQLKNCKNFNIATAFITSEGVNALQSFLEVNKNRMSSNRLIISLYQSFNSQETLIALKALHTKSKGRILVHISKNLQFHWKYYGFENANNITTFIGSANFTSAGIEGIGEITTKISFTSRDKLSTTQLRQMFDKEFENSISIEKFPLELYKSSSLSLKKSYSKITSRYFKITRRKKYKDRR